MNEYQAVKDGEVAFSTADLKEGKQHEIAVQSNFPSPSPAQASEASTLMAVIEKMATMPDLDMDKIERMFQMHQKMVDRTQQQAFNCAMAKAQAEMEPVAANCQNKNTGSEYAAIDAIHRDCKPIWCKHGFSVSSSTRRSDLANHISVVVEVMHSAGFVKIYANDWPLDNSGLQGKTNKTPIQAMVSSTTYARRSCEIAIFDLAVAKTDRDGNGSSRIGSLDVGRVKRLRDALKVTSYTEQQVCSSYGVESFEDLPIENFNPILNKLKKAAHNG